MAGDPKTDRVQEQKLKIVFIVPRFRPFKGGAEQFAWQLAKRSAAAGHAVTVLTTDASPDGKPLPAREVAENVEIVRFKRWNQQLNLGFYPGLLPGLLRMKADVIHVHNGPGFIWQDFCLILKRVISRRTKFIASPHGPFLATHNHRGMKAAAAAAARLLLPPFFRILWSRLFHAVTAGNPRQHIWLTRDYGIRPERIYLLPIGISEAELKAGEKPFPADGSLQITYVNRFEKYKGVQDILTALETLISLGVPREKLRFTAMGRPGDHFPTLLEMTREKHLEDIVEYIANPGDELRDRILWEDSQVNILPSEWEAAGIALIEAMAKGNTIITTTGNEAAELLTNEGRNGYIFEFGDDGRLAGILHELWQDPEKLKRMCAASRVTARSLTWEQIFPGYLDILNQVTRK